MFYPLVCISYTTFAPDLKLLLKGTFLVLTEQRSSSADFGKMPCRQQNEISIPLRVQTPSKKVFWGGFRGLNPFSGGTWTLRVHLTLQGMS